MSHQHSDASNLQAPCPDCQPMRAPRCCTTRFASSDRQPGCVAPRAQHTQDTHSLHPQERRASRHSPCGVVALRPSAHLPMARRERGEKRQEDAGALTRDARQCACASQSQPHQAHRERGPHDSSSANQSPPAPRPTCGRALFPDQAMVRDLVQLLAGAHAQGSSGRAEP